MARKALAFSADTQKKVSAQLGAATVHDDIGAQAPSPALYASDTLALVARSTVAMIQRNPPMPQLVSDHQAEQSFPAQQSMYAACQQVRRRRGRQATHRRGLRQSQPDRALQPLARPIQAAC